MEPRGTESLDRVLTVAEVAEYLRVSTKTVYALVANGELPSFRIGRALRCRMSAVQAFIIGPRDAGTVAGGSDR